MATNGNANHQELQSAATPTTEAATASAGGNNLSKDEVGWYFVEQYYTILSKSPEKLHLFYGKRSQFVYGLEAEIANVSVGRQAIQDRIKALDFQDCKVRISNVDSQASHENIVIQVIGETSNKAGEPKKFVQTFVLAQQPSGYFVLNDILRYINEEGEEDQDETPEAEAAPAPEPEAPAEVEAEPAPEVGQPDKPSQEKEPVHFDAAIVDNNLEEVRAAAPDTPSSTVITPAEPAVPEPEPTVEQSEPESEPVDPVLAIQEIAEEDAKKPETPLDPSPTPVVPVASSPVVTEPEKPKEPPKPMTWASRIAAATGPPLPRQVALPKTATPPAPAQSRTPVPAATQQSGASLPSAADATPAAASSKDLGNEWQTAGADSKRQNRPQSISGPPAEKEGTMAYIKYVTDKVKPEDLRAALAQHGELAYFDINRQKSCAFVEFATQAGYNAAVAANPHTVNGESIVVEQRRPKANAYGGTNYNAARGGPAGRGRGGFEGTRTGSQGGPRGGYTGQARGRGGGTTPRGARGASQTANA